MTFYFPSSAPSVSLNTSPSNEEPGHDYELEDISHISQPAPAYLRHQRHSQFNPYLNSSANLLDAHGLLRPPPIYASPSQSSLPSYSDDNATEAHLLPPPYTSQNTFNCGGKAPRFLRVLLCIVAIVAILVFIIISAKFWHEDKQTSTKT